MLSWLLKHEGARVTRRTHVFKISIQFVRQSWDHEKARAGNSIANFLAWAESHCSVAMFQQRLPRCLHDSARGRNKNLSARMEDSLLKTIILGLKPRRRSSRKAHPRTCPYSIRIFHISQYVFQEPCLHLLPSRGAAARYRRSSFRT